MAYIRFTLNSHRYELSDDDVRARLADVIPEPIRKHSVCIGGVWYPVKQAFEVAIGVPRTDYVSLTARRHLEALGFELRGERTPRDAQSGPHRIKEPSAGAGHVVAGGGAEDWHGEASVQAAVVTALAAAGWRILSVADTVTKERGVDVVAARGGESVGVEVRGFPSRVYADPARANEKKRTLPSTQAGHWYSQAILAAMRLRSREPEWRSVIALPDFPRYRDLHRETVGPLAAAGIEVWWVESDGDLRM